MKYREHHNERRIAALSDFGAAAVGYCIARRLRPNYSIFAKRTGHGGEAVLDGALSSVADALMQNRPRDLALAALADACAGVCPHADDYEDGSTSFAIYSAAAVVYTCRFMADGDRQSIVWLLRNQYEAAFEYADFVFDADVDVRRVDRSTVVQGELKLQRKLLRMARRVDAGGLEKMRGIATNRLGDSNELIWGVLPAWGRQ